MMTLVLRMYGTGMRIDQRNEVLNKSDDINDILNFG